MEKSQATYTIQVWTGDRQNAGTNSNIIMVLHGENGDKSPEYTLNKPFRNDFKCGEVDEFKASLPKTISAKFGKVVKIEFWRDNRGISPDWYLDRTEVYDIRTNETFIFPVFRWVKADYHYVINHLDTALPQDDENKEQRQMELEDKKRDYVLTQKIANGPAQVQTLPADEDFSFSHKFDVTLLGTKLKAGVFLTKLMTGQWDSVESVKNVYKGPLLPLPQGAERWQSDRYFAWQRIAGCSYDLIKLCKEIPDKFGVTNKMMKPILEGKSLKEALDNNALYIVDLEILLGIKPKEHYVVCAPLALFYQNDKKQLFPVAIQLFQEKTLDNPVFLPTDPKYTWLAAKMWYNMADASYHQSITHLGYTHLLMEGVTVSAHRNLSVSHPVFKLLAPHFLYLLAINNLAMNALLVPGGWVDNAMAIGLAGLTELLVKGLKRWRMDVDGQLPERLKERGLLEADTLENFPFRDDAVLLYGAIKRYVTKYINHYYDSAERIAGDWELQNWATELVRARPDGGVGLNGVPGNGKFSTADDVIEVVTSIVYICSVGHASANFPQYDEYGFSPNYPGLLHGHPPKDKTALTEEDIVTLFPDINRVLDTAIMTKILTQRDTLSLGNFEVNYIFDPPAKKIVEEFRTDLRNIGDKIRERNQKSDIPYPYLDPNLIPNSINV